LEKSRNSLNSRPALEFQKFPWKYGKIKYQKMENDPLHISSVFFLDCFQIGGSNVV
jgi:hypothetical protein